MQNGNRNRHIEIYLGLIRQIISDTSDSLVRLRASVFPMEQTPHLLRMLQLDFAAIRRRANSEGLPFLTSTLPVLGRWLDEMMEKGTYIDVPEGFAPYEGIDMPYPLLLGSFWELFIKELVNPGSVADEAEFHRTIRKVRSLLYGFYKLEVPFTPHQLDRSLRAYIDADWECGVRWSTDSAYVLEEAKRVVDRVLQGFDPYDIYPRHGPGALATGERQEAKWDFSHFYPDLHHEYPYQEYLWGIKENGNAAYSPDELNRLMYGMGDETQPTSKVVFVPKDSRGPRTICSEPLEIQFIQQGIARALVAHLEHHCALTRGHVNFTSQEVNQSLALENSRSRMMATLDLSEASDRLSLELFQEIWPLAMQGPFLATRSTHTTLPDGRVMELRKFAPMGSALCFPVESLIFWAISVASLIWFRNVPFNVARQVVYVYGDDIIVPTEHVQAVICGLESAGLNVNRSKSCYRSGFRESCGVDARNGFNVTPQKIRKPPCSSPAEGLAAEAWLAYSANYWNMGMFHSSLYCYEIVCQAFGSSLPITSVPVGYLSAVIPDLAWSPSDYPGIHWDRSLQSFKARVWVVKPKFRPTRLDSWKRLLRNLLVPMEDCNPSEEVMTNITKTVRSIRLIDV